MTNHVLDRLPLWVAGDLEAPEAEAVQAHLDRCPACRRAAEGLRETRTWLQASLEPPFTPADHAALREAVLDRVRREPAPRRPTRFTPRAALSATAAAVLLLLVLARPWRRTAGVPAEPPPSEVPPPVPRAVLLPAAPPSPPPRLARLHRPPAEAPEAPPGPARIEFQTSDPTVRIIWLAQATPAPDPHSAVPEEP